MRLHNVVLGEPDSIEFTWLLVRHSDIVYTGQVPFQI